MSNKPKTYAKSFEVEQKNKHTDIRNVENQYAIYAYVRKSDNKVMYIGKDSWINKGNRRSTHQQIGKINAQKFHMELYKQRDDITYEIISIASNKDWMDDIEAALISVFKSIGQCEWNYQDELEI